MPKRKNEKNAKSGGVKRQNPIRGSSKATSSSSSAAAIHPTSSVRGSNKATKSKKTLASSSSLTTANQQPSLDTGNPTMASKVFCILDDDLSLFSVDYFRDEMIDTLKGRIKPDLDPIGRCNVTLWKADIPIVGGANYKNVVDDTKKDRNNKMGPADLVKEHILKVLSKTIQIVIELPKQASKRSLEVDEQQPYKRARTIRKAIAEAGLKNGTRFLSLNSKERVQVLSCLDRDEVGDMFNSISETAHKLQESGDAVRDLDVLSCSDTQFPVVGTNDLFVRQEYKELYDRIISRFTLPTKCLRQNRLIVTGTSGIGKSAFLVYFAIRLLAESDENDPPIIVFHQKESRTCYVYGRMSVIYSTNILDVVFLLGLPETWYLVNSSEDPVLSCAKSIFSVSPKTLTTRYKGVAKETPNYYHMSPWKLDELEQCRVKIRYFNRIEPDFMKALYSKNGGAPGYILQIPADVLSSDANNIELAEKRACSCVDDAINTVTDPAKLLQCFALGMGSEEFSDHMVRKLPRALYLNSVIHVFKKGGFKFDIKDLNPDSDSEVLNISDSDIEDLSPDSNTNMLDIPTKPQIKYFKTLNELSALSTNPGTFFKTYLSASTSDRDHEDLGKGKN
ncbi:hypothetical protein BGX21_001547 [Mortierella sp. AD011]|nr:hypothetical protein BGX21_001547 [Mortierella sp. AD011]